MSEEQEQYPGNTITIEQLVKLQAEKVVNENLKNFEKHVLETSVKDAVAEARKKANIEAFNQVSNTFRVAEMSNKLLELPGKIQEHRQNVNDLRTSTRNKRQALSDVELQMKEIETNLLLDITEEVDESGKKKFSNDKARQAELTRRKKEDADYVKAQNEWQTVKQELENLEDDIADEESKLKKKKNEFQAYCKMLEATTAQMNIYAQICGVNVKEMPQMDVIFAEDKNQEKGAW